MCARLTVAGVFPQISHPLSTCHERHSTDTSMCMTSPCVHGDVPQDDGVLCKSGTLRLQSGTCLMPKCLFVVVKVTLLFARKALQHGVVQEKRK